MRPVRLSFLGTLVILYCVVLGCSAASVGQGEALPADACCYSPHRA